MKFRAAITRMRHLHPRHILFVGGIVVVLVAFTLVLSFFIPKKIAYAYGGEHCTGNPLLLPSLHTAEQSEHFLIEHKPGLTIFGFPLVSLRSCAQMVKYASEGEQYTIHAKAFGFPLLKQTTTITAAPQPRLHSSSATLPKLISIKDPLHLQLNQEDATFLYQLVAEKSRTTCTKANNKLSCDVQSLQLKQATIYEMRLERLFKDQPVGTVLKQSVQTVSPIEITSTSIAQNTVVYDAPSSIVITTNKKIAKHSGVELLLIADDKKKERISAQVAIDNQKVIITPSQPFPRQRSFELHIAGLTASDQGFLNSPYVLNFQTSGGPKVIGSNIGSYGIATSATFRLTFDASIATSQNLGQYISIKVGGNAVDYTPSLQGAQLYINPTTDLPRCTAFSIVISEGLQNIHSVSGDTARTFSSRTICQEVFSIGTSVQGRSITAYRFGNGASKVVYLGATHGDESGSKHLLDSWINELEAGYHKIPAHRSIIVIPALNGDGFAAGTRVNARNVDLNRNFPAANWKKDVVMPGGQLLVNGGGTSALSEPESNAIASYIVSQQPRLVLSYHSKGAMVIANESGDSAALAGVYAGKSNYWARTESQLGNTFAYDTTGAFENWLHEKHALPVLLIELATHTQNEFWRNKSAMWAMATL